MKKLLMITCLTFVAGILVYGSTKWIGPNSGQTSATVLSDPSELFMGKADAGLRKCDPATTNTPCTCLINPTTTNVECDVSMCHPNQYCPNNGNVGTYCCATLPRKKF